MEDNGPGVSQDDMDLLYLYAGSRKWSPRNTRLSINELVLNWATTRHSDSVEPLSLEEIELLRKYLIVKATACW